MRQLTAVGLVFAVLILPATAQIDPAAPQSAPGLPAPNTANRQDKSFAQLIAANYLAAVEFGEMASAKAHRNEVRQFARRLVLDHSKAIANLERLTKQAHIPVSDSLGPVDVVIKQQLESLSGSAFDLAYVRDQLFTHHMAIMLLESEVKQGQDGSLQKLAAESLPVVIARLRLAGELLDELTGTTIPVGLSGGDVQTAQRAALTLLAQKGSALWRRLMVIAFEDVAAGSSEAVASIVAAITDPNSRKANGGDLQVAIDAARLLANAPKDRSADYLICAAKDHPSLEPVRTECALASIAQRLDAVADLSRPLEERAVFAWYASGLEWGAEKRVGKGDLPALLDTFRAMGVQESWVGATGLTAKRTREPITLMVPLIWLRGSLKFPSPRPVRKPHPEASPARTAVDIVEKRSDSSLCARSNSSKPTMERFG